MKQSGIQVVSPIDTHNPPKLDPTTIVISPNLVRSLTTFTASLIAFFGEKDKLGAISQYPQKTVLGILRPAPEQAHLSSI